MEGMELEAQPQSEKCAERSLPSHVGNGTPR